MSTIEEKYEFTTPEDSIRECDWAAGSATQITSHELVIRHSETARPTFYGEFANVKYSPAWLKTIDEPIVNALDQMVRCRGNGHSQMTDLRVDFSPTGRVSVYNNGAGIEVAIHQVASQHYGKEV